MLVTSAYALALLPILSLAQIYPITIGDHVTSITLPPFVQPTAAATDSSLVTVATPVETPVETPTETLTETTPATPTSNNTIEATPTNTVNPFLGAASSMRGSCLAAALAGFAVLGMLYG